MMPVSQVKKISLIGLTGFRVKDYSEPSLTKRKELGMELHIKQMNYDAAKIISKWIYQEPYSIYNMDGSDGCIDELFNGDYFLVSDEENNIIGYFCFGESAQVPVGKHFCAYEI
jgi:hypothetical protein